MKIVAKDDIVTRKIGDKLYLVPTSGSVYSDGAVIELNSTGEVIWTFIVTSRYFELEMLISHLSDIYENVESIDEDISEFIECLVECEIVTVE